jgi:hypothetical protein
VFAPRAGPDRRAGAREAEEQRRVGALHLGFGRIVASEKEAPNMLVNLV